MKTSFRLAEQRSRLSLTMALLMAFAAQGLRGQGLQTFNPSDQDLFLEYGEFWKRQGEDRLRLSAPKDSTGYSADVQLLVLKDPVFIDEVARPQIEEFVSKRLVGTSLPVQNFRIQESSLRVMPNGLVTVNLFSSFDFGTVEMMQWIVVFSSRTHAYILTLTDRKDVMMKANSVNSAEFWTLVNSIKVEKQALPRSQNVLFVFLALSLLAGLLLASFIWRLTRSKHRHDRMAEGKLIQEDFEDSHADKHDQSDLDISEFASTPQKGSWEVEFSALNSVEKDLADEQEKDQIGRSA